MKKNKNYKSNKSSKTTKINKSHNKISKKLFWPSVIVIGAVTFTGAQFILGSANAATNPPIYVALGDSIAVGAQPGPGPTDYHRTTGYTGYVAKAKGYKLVNFGCAGATTSSAINGGACTTIGPSSYGGGSQLDAAERYLRSHRGKVKLVTVELGINDGLSPPITPNMNTITRGLRKAAGPNVKMVGLTYYDPILQYYIKGDAASKNLAQNSVAQIRDGLNNPLKQVYSQNHYAVADVGKAFGMYISFSHTASIASYGNIPRAVAYDCLYTWGCNSARPDIHPNSKGHSVIAKSILNVL